MVTSYCDHDAIKDRLLVKTTDTVYDTSMDAAIVEASRILDIFLKPYITVPLTTVSEQVAIITADFASSIFKRRYIPDEVKLRGSMQPDMINDVDGTGWFAIALKRTQDYIKSYYTLEQDIQSSSYSVNDPDIYLSLFKDGVITGKEARELMSNANSTIVKKLNEISTSGRTETNSVTQTNIESLLSNVQKTSNESITRLEIVTEYKTKRQKTFFFVESDVNNQGYKLQDNA